MLTIRIYSRAYIFRHIGLKSTTSTYPTLYTTAPLSIPQPLPIPQLQNSTGPLLITMKVYSGTPVRGKYYKGPADQDRAPQDPASNGLIPNEKPSEVNSLGIDADAPPGPTDPTSHAQVYTASYDVPVSPAVAQVPLWSAGVYDPGSGPSINRKDNAADALRDFDRFF